MVRRAFIETQTRKFIPKIWLKKVLRMTLGFIVMSEYFMEKQR